jgi:hypothetical protein
MGDLCLDGKIILKLILKMYGVTIWTGFIWLRIRSNCVSIVNGVMNLCVPWNSGNFLANKVTTSFLSRAVLREVN